MIDIHCHLLPGIDDGAPDQAYAVKMAGMAVKNGIHTMVFTPHIHPGRFENTRPLIKGALSQFRAALLENEIDLKTEASAEVRLCPEIPVWVKQNELPWLGQLNGQKVFLLEFPHSHIPPGSDRLIDWLRNNDIQPLIAHPERNKDVLRDLNKIKPFVNAGCLLQLTAGSVSGNFGDVAQERSRQMLENGWVFVLASDAHNLDHRVPDLEPGRKAAAEIIGEAEATKLVTENPYSIVSSLLDGVL